MSTQDNRLHEMQAPPAADMRPAIYMPTAITVTVLDGKVRVDDVGAFCRLPLPGEPPDPTPILVLP